MKKVIAIALVICIFLISTIPVFADFTSVPVSRFTYAVYGGSGATLGTANLSVYPPSPQSITLSTPSDLSAANLLRINADFLVGAKYSLTYVIYDPDAQYTSNPAAILYQPVTGEVQTNLICERVAFSEDPSLITRYPNPFPSLYGVTDQMYNEGSYLVTVEFTPEFSNVQLELSTHCYYTSSSISVGAAYISCRTTYEESTFYFLDGIFSSITDIVAFLNSTLYTTLNSIRSSVVDGFDQVHSDLTKLTGAVGQGLQMSEEDEEDFAEQDSQTDAAVQNANNKLNQTTQKNEQNKQQISNKQDKADDLEDQRQEAERQEQDFKNDFNIDGASAISGSINSGISSSGSYGSALIWWGNAFSEILRFTPIVFMLNVSVFFGLLMLLFGASSRMMVRHEVRGRRRGGD